RPTMAGDEGAVAAGLETGAQRLVIRDLRIGGALAGKRGDRLDRGVVDRALPHLRHTRRGAAADAGRAPDTPYERIARVADGARTTRTSRGSTASASAATRSSAPASMQEMLSQTRMVTGGRSGASSAMTSKWW